VGGESRLNIDPSNDRAAIWRLTASGAVDVTFGDAGWLSDEITAGTSAVYCSGLVLQADGKAVWGGNVFMESNLIYAVLARFWQ
jgi:hypothetical protein